MSRRLKAEGAVAWIFQANPDDWRITDYLAAAVREPGLRDTVWEVKPESYGALIEVGHPAFIWRAAGLGKRDARKPRIVAGIVARGRITGPPRMLPDTQIDYRWRSRDAKFEGDQFRAPMHIESVLRGQIDRPTLEAQEALVETAIVRWARQRTTYPIKPDELPAFERLYAARPALL